MHIFTRLDQVGRAEVSQMAAHNSNVHGREEKCSGQTCNRHLVITCKVFQTHDSMQTNKKITSHADVQAFQLKLFHTCRVSLYRQ